MYDIIFCGGGLAAGLTAWRLHLDKPDLRLLIVEQGSTLGGNHTWSFFKSDLSTAQFQWLTPLIDYRWDEYEVRFPGMQRHLPSTYCSTTSETFHKKITAALPNDAVRTNTQIASLSASELNLKNGDKLIGRCIIDCRGPGPDDHLALGFQKFTGQVLKLAVPHGLAGPIIMDATIPQDNDYRFIYTLPFTSTSVLIEDTRYSNTPGVDTEADRIAIRKYAEDQGWQPEDCIKEEQGVLPIMLGGDINGFWDTEQTIPRLGLRAALFHATTGYSLPDAVRAAEHLSTHCPSPISSEAVYNVIRSYSVKHFRNQRYLQLLNRMLYLAATPNERYIILRRFHCLSQALIERFYAGQLHFTDKLRILMGRPPVSLKAAIKCLPEKSAGNVRQQNRGK